MLRISSDVADLGLDLVSLRRDLHRHPELEVATRTFERAPGCFVFVGSANASKGLDHDHHNPRVDFDEDALDHRLRVSGAGRRGSPPAVN